MNTDYYRTAVCPECGKVFPLTAEHALTNGKKVPVCSCHCSTAAWKREEAERLERRKRAREKRRAYEQHRRELLKAQQGAEIKPHGNGKPVDVYTKEGVFVKRYPSSVAAAKATSYSDSWIRRVCSGGAELPGDYTYRYANSKEGPKA